LAALPGSVTFTNAFADAAWSLPAYTSLFTGQDPLTHGVGFLQMTLEPGKGTMAEMFSAYGYHTRAHCSGPHLDPQMGLNHGFEHYGHEIRSASITPRVTEAINWMAETPTEPFFMFVHGYDAHYPYSSPLLISERFTQNNHVSPGQCPARVGRGWRCISTEHQDNDHIIAHYDSAILYADYQLGRLLWQLQEQELLENTIVIALSDHGEELGERNLFFHDSGRGDPVFHVPLVIHLPGSDKPRTWDGVVSLSGLLPTLASLLDMTPPAGVNAKPFSTILDPSSTPNPDDAVLSASMCCYNVRTIDWALEGIRMSESGTIDWMLFEDGKGPDVADTNLDIVNTLIEHTEGWPADLGDLRTLNESAARNRPALKSALQEGGYWSSEDE